MTQDQELTTLDGLLNRIEEATQDSDRLSVAAILKVIGRRSFGPLLLVAGLITLAPVIGDIPGVPTVIGVLVFLISIQLLFHHQHIWLPHWLLKRSLARAKVCKAIKWMRRPARFMDRMLRPRLEMFIEGSAYYVIAAICVLISALMPAMELIPFSANAAGAALTALGLALIARDGLMALIAVGIVVTTGALTVYNFL